MLNGYVEQRIIGKKDALVMNNVKNAGSQDSQIDAAFLSILNRKPTSKEKSLLKSSLKVSGDNFYKDSFGYWLTAMNFCLFNNSFQYL